MATKKQSRSKVPAGEPEVTQQESVQPQEEILSDEIGQETVALIGVAEKLEKVSQNFASQKQQQQQFLTMQKDIENILTRIVTGIEESNVASARQLEKISAPQVQQAAPISSNLESPHGSEDDCGCGCVSPGCCCFEIVLEKMRATAHQLEPSDSGELPFVVNAMEVQLYTEANGSGIMFPSIASFVDLRIDNILLSGGSPGPWVYIKQVVNRVYVKKGTTMRCPFSFQVRESDERLTEQATGAGKDEFGDASGYIDLNCCVPVIYPELTTEISLNYGGKGGGRIQVVVFARRVCG
jgi:hypothetical protein